MTVLTPAVALQAPFSETTAGRQPDAPWLEAMEPTEVPGRPTRVLFIAGSGRSGSTVLANILGSVEGVFSAGEVRYLWQRGVQENRLCGCGRSFAECPVWNAILAETVGDPGAVDVDALLALSRRGNRIRHLPLLLLGRGGDDRISPRLGAYRDVTARLYPAIGRVSGSSLIVDSSKLPAHGSLLAGLPDIELFVLHLVRDPRATAYSWRRRKPLADGAASPVMERQSLLKSAVLWDVWNFTASALWASSPERYLRIRYEDFVRRPRAHVERILAFAGHDGDAGSVFVDDRTVRLAVTHTVAGNPDRLRRGDLALRPDDEWALRMRPRDRALVSAVTGPLRSRFYTAAPAG
jgi:Sulfotransferase family